MRFFRPFVLFTQTTLCLVGGFFFFVSSVHAATYYVDINRGNDSNNGTSISTPWQNIGKLRTVRNSIVAGDTILLACDSAWNGGVYIDSGFVGTSTSRITITSYAPSGVTCGSNKPTLMRYTDTTEGSWVWDAGNSRWYISGPGYYGTGSFLLGPTASTPSIRDGQPFGGAESMPNRERGHLFSITNQPKNYLYTAGGVNPVTYYNGVRYLYAAALDFYGESGSYTTVEGLKFTDCGRSVRIWGDPGLENHGFIFRNNEVDQCNNIIDFDASAWGQVTDYEVSNNQFTNIYSYGIHVGSRSGPNVLIKDNYFQDIALSDPSGGAVYVQGQEINQNVLVTGNEISYVHFGIDDQTDPGALYAENFSSGITFENNYVHHSHLCMTDNSGQSTNVFRNNICNTDLGINISDASGGGESFPTVINNTFLCSANRFIEHTTSGQESCIANYPSSSSVPIIKNNLIYRSPDLVTSVNTILRHDGNFSSLDDTTNNIWQASPPATVFAHTWIGPDSYDASNVRVADIGVISTSPATAMDARLTESSPAIDAGINLSLTTDYLGNPIYGTPDIGAFEYQPPYTINTDPLDISSGARVYADGKFRSLGVTSGPAATLAVSPVSGSFPSYGATVTRPAWMDITSITWVTTGNYHKQWTESSTTIGSASTLHSVGDLAPNAYYAVTVDSAASIHITGTNCVASTCLSDGTGTIEFLYSGGYSTHTFEILPGTSFAADPTINSINSDKANGSYKQGVVIDIDVLFSEAVTSSGNVTVTLETGATDRTCTFTITNNTFGTCNYTVQAGDTSADLTVNSISGTILNQMGDPMTNFVPATNLAANKALVIDTTAPTNQDTVFPSSVTDSGDATITIVSSGTATNTVWFAPSGTTTFVASGTMTTTGGTATTIFAPAVAGNYKLFVLDLAGNISTASTATLTVDTTLPVRSGGSPSGVLAAGTTSVSLSLTTDEAATCKYGTASDTVYASIGNTFTTTGGTTHAATLSSLSDGTSYVYYVRCQDGAGHSNINDYTVSFSVGTLVMNTSHDNDNNDKKKSSKKKASIHDSPKSVRRGETLVQSGKNFAKNRNIALYFSRPNGSYYPPLVVKTNGTGGFKVSYRVTKPPGKYTWYARDTVNNTKTKASSYRVW